jgi:hypothetical protein
MQDTRGKAVCLSKKVVIEAAVRCAFPFTRNARIGRRGTLSGGAGRTWNEAALVAAGSAGLGMHMEGAGGSGRGSSGEGNCSSLHMEMYLRIRVVFRVLQGCWEQEHRWNDAPREPIRQRLRRAGAPALPDRWW